MIRSVKIASNDVNSGKLRGVEEFLRTYNSCVNYFIKRLWSEKIFDGKFIDGLYIESAKKRFHLTSRLIQCAGKQALEIVKSQRKKTCNQRSMPRFKRLMANLDSRFWRITKNQNTYEWLRLQSEFDFLVPFNRTKMWNKWSDEDFGLSSSLRIFIRKDKLVIEFFFEKDAPELKSEGETEGLDLGYRNLAVCSSGQTVGGRLDKTIKSFSKREKHTHKQMEQKSFQELKKLDLSNVSMLVVEDLKHVKSGTRGTFSRQGNRRMSHWLYAKVREWLKQRCEEQGIRLEFKSPFATSQYCRFCGKWDRRNRSGDKFKCIYCGHEDHADSNSSWNLKLLGLAEVYSLRLLTNQVRESLVGIL